MRKVFEKKIQKQLVVFWDFFFLKKKYTKIKTILPFHRNATKDEAFHLQQTNDQEFRSQAHHPHRARWALELAEVVRQAPKRESLQAECQNVHEHRLFKNEEKRRER